MARYPAGIIRKTPVTPAGPLQNGAASGVWSLADAAYWTKQGLWPLAGNVLAVEDVFSTWLYTGNAGSQTITNGINLSGQGGMIWIKRRDGANDHILQDTSRGVNNYLVSNSTAAQTNTPSINFGFASNGFSQNNAINALNQSGFTYASWTFREAPNFFDVVTYTGNSTNRTIAHNLGSVPGCIIVKQTSAAGTNWRVYHRGLTSAAYTIQLNQTNAESSQPSIWNSTAPTSTEFSVGTDISVNDTGQSYVAYLFAHDTASTGIIQCGSYTGNGYAGSVPNTVTLGWEPQWVMVKKSSSGVAPSDWFMFDNMRGMPVASAQTQFLSANTSGSEIADVTTIQPTSTGFQLVRNYSGTNANGETYVYIAIRRGPMKTPTLGTSVFAPTTVASSVSAGTVITTNLNTDLQFGFVRAGSGAYWADRLRGVSSTDTNGGQQLLSYNSNAETTSNITRYWQNTGFTLPTSWAGSDLIFYNFRRAPGFFDEVCYTGTGANLTLNHNLGVVPELMIVKGRSGATAWQAYSANLTNTEYLVLNATAAKATGATRWNSTTPSATTFTVGTASEVNTSAATYVAYLFASCPGVSKVGSYTGTGALQTINCAFTTGARYVLIKRTDSTGDWYVWDSARGISSGNDPYLLLNSTAAETTGTNYVDTDTTGFKVTAAAPAGINANGGSYIFLAIA